MGSCHRMPSCVPLPVVAGRPLCVPKTISGFIR
jgi:hypothetical protein